MQDIKQKIISVLKDRGTEVSTSEIIESVSDEYKKLRKERKYNEARQLQRRVLYYINTLVDERIIRLEKYGKIFEVEAKHTRTNPLNKLPFYAGLSKM